jgi:hypothetical protein
MDLPADELSAGEAAAPPVPKISPVVSPKAADRTPKDIGDLLGAGGKPKVSIATSSQSAGTVAGAVDALGAAFDAFESHDEAEAQAVQKSMAAEAEMEARAIAQKALTAAAAETALAKNKELIDDFEDFQDFANVDEGEMREEVGEKSLQPTFRSSLEAQQSFDDFDAPAEIEGPTGTAGSAFETQASFDDFDASGSAETDTAVAGPAMEAQASFDDFDAAFGETGFEDFDGASGGESPQEF